MNECMLTLSCPISSVTNFGFRGATTLDFILRVVLTPLAFAFAVAISSTNSIVAKASSSLSDLANHLKHFQDLIYTRILQSRQSSILDFWRYEDMNACTVSMAPKQPQTRSGDQGAPGDW